MPNVSSAKEHTQKKKKLNCSLYQHAIIQNKERQRNQLE